MHEPDSWGQSAKLSSRNHFSPSRRHATQCRPSLFWRRPLACSASAKLWTGRSTFSVHLGQDDFNSNSIKKFCSRVPGCVFRIWSASRFPPPGRMCSLRASSRSSDSWNYRLQAAERSSLVNFSAPRALFRACSPQSASRCRSKNGNVEDSVRRFERAAHAHTQLEHGPGEG